MKKRIIALLLCLLMTGSTLSCGSEEPSGDTTVSGSDSTGIDEGPSSRVPAGTTFDGATVHILNGQYFESYYYLVDASESSGDTVNDAVYERNLAVQSKLDIQFKYTNIHNTTQRTMQEMLRSSVMAGDKEWDIVHDVEFSAVEMSIEGLLYDFIDAPYIDVTDPWWATTYLEQINISPDHLYFLTGDFSIGHANQMSVMYYNKAVLEDYLNDGELLYQEVLDGKWTLDRMHELCGMVTEDLNGNNTIDIADRIGMGNEGTIYITDHFFYAAGGRVMSRDKDGVPYIDGMSDLNVGITDKLWKLFYENPGVVQEPSKGRELIDDVLLPKFKNGESLFFSGLLRHADMLRDMPDDYGLIPYPKYDETIENYSALVHNQSASLYIPRVSDTTDMACAVIEEMAFQGYQTMMPEYYSTALMVKYMRDSDDAAVTVMNTILDARTTDLAFSLLSKIDGIGYMCKYAFRQGNANYASLYDATIESATTKFNNILAFFEE